LGRTKTYLHPDAKVLELGAGTGSTAILLAPHAGQVIATDVSPEMMSIGREKAVAQNAANVTFLPAQSDDARFGDSSHDAVLAFNLLHLLRDLDGTLVRANAALKPGGYFISKSPCLGEKGWYLPVMVGLVRAFMAIRYWGTPPFVRFMKIQDLEDRIQTHGFEIIETGNYPADPPNRYIVARKR
jgi:ubiquinone/menaquinone biosynthesis C-methylase UbiE